MSGRSAPGGPAPLSAADTTGRVAGRPVAVASSALPGLDVEVLAATAAGAGLGGVEWGIGAGHPLPVTVPESAVRRLSRTGAREGLACCGVAVHDEDALTLPARAWPRLGAAAAALGAPHVRVYATAPEGPFTEDFERLRRRLATAAEGVATAGVRLLVEPAPMTLVPDPALAARALADIDPRHAGVVYDPGSLAREGWLDPYLATGVLGTLLRHVHAKNVSPVREADGTWVWRRAGLACGIVDWPRVFGALDAAGYDGWLVLDHLRAHTGACLSGELSYLRAVAGREAG